MQELAKDRRDVAHVDLHPNSSIDAVASLPNAACTLHQRLCLGYHAPEPSLALETFVTRGMADSLSGVTV